MPEVIIKRSSEYINSLRSCHIVIDGEKAGEVKNGKTIQITIPPGRHTIKSTIDWCGSRELTFEAGPEDRKQFHLSGFRYSKWFMVAGLLLAPVGIAAMYLFDNYLLMLPQLFLGAVLVYYLSVGRSKYLTLKHEE
ncbi:MAG: hypothetical protein H7257_07160 [Taibaiella sp.]|nr:hypothetical protein [Taibaiella sp.]